MIETDPKKIAQRLEQTRQARQNARPTSHDEAVRQIKAHARSARQQQEKRSAK